jgi:hypothetical protein
MGKELQIFVSKVGDKWLAEVYERRGGSLECVWARDDFGSEADGRAAANAYVSGPLLAPAAPAAPAAAPTTPFAFASPAAPMPKYEPVAAVPVPVPAERKPRKPRSKEPKAHTLAGLDLSDIKVP